MTSLREYIFAKYAFIYAIIVIAGLSPLFSQTSIPYYKLEQMSYRYYVNQAWDSLIAMEKKYRPEDIHSYALDLRYGAACFHKKNYRKALRFFENLDLKQSRDLLLLEYRYYAYLQSGRPEDARKLCLDFEALSQQTDFCKEKVVATLGVESKIFRINQNFREDDAITATQKISKSREYYAFYLQLSSLKNWQFTLAPMWLYERNEYRNTAWENPLWNENVVQNHLYMSARYAIGYGKRIWLNDHYVMTQTEAQPVDSTSNYYSYHTDEKHIAGLFYQHSIRSLDFIAGVQYAPQDSVDNIIPSLGVSWYPWGNDRFFIYTCVSHQPSASSPREKWLIKQKWGVKLWKKLWVEPFGMYGKTTHYYDEQGYVIYAQQEKMNYYWGVDMQYFPGKKYALYASFQKYNLTKEIRYGEETKFYDTNFPSLLFGIKWQLK